MITDSPWLLDSENLLCIWSLVSASMDSFSRVDCFCWLTSLRDFVSSNSRFWRDASPFSSWARNRATWDSSSVICIKIFMDATTLHIIYTRVIEYVAYYCFKSMTTTQVWLYKLYLYMYTNQCSAEHLWRQQKQMVTDGRQSYPYVVLCFAGTTKMWLPNRRTDRCQTKWSIKVSLLSADNIIYIFSQSKHIHST